MSPLALVSVVYSHASHGLRSRWGRCHRNLKRVFAFAGGIGTVLSVCGALYAQGLLPASQGFVRSEVRKQLGPMGTKIATLQLTITSLQKDLVDRAVAPSVTADLAAAIGRIEGKLDSLNKAKSNTPR